MIDESNIEIPEHFFRALCQKCKEPVGGFHIPTNGGMVLFICKCGAVSAFKNEAYGIRSRLVPEGMLRKKKDTA